MRTAREHFYVVLIAIAACRAGGFEERTILAQTHAGMLRLYVSGTRGSGQPTVILEAGLGDPSQAWRKVAAAVAGSTQVVRYDRAGLGASPAAATMPRTAKEIASELHDALVSAGIDPPYVLVSHSAGAWYVVVFTAQHPSEVKALVLLDPTPPNFFNEVTSLQNEQERAEFASSIAKYEADASPARRAEWQSRSLAAKQAEAVTLPKHLPLVVITAAAPQPGRNPAILRYWRDQHARMAQATSNGRLVVANTGHYVQLEQPSLVAREIQRLLKTLRGA